MAVKTTTEQIQRAQELDRLRASLPLCPVHCVRMIVAATTPTTRYCRCRISGCIESQVISRPVSQN